MRALEKYLAIAAAIACWAAPRAAFAYPQWQFSSGTSRCTQCHFSPAGGGLVTDYGRDAVGDDLSTWKGNGGFLHGAVALPSWLALGFDGRGAILSHDAGSPRHELAIFPMQADASARAAFHDAFSIYVVAGYRGRARGAGEAVAPENFQPAGGSGFISREHYLMWRPQAMGGYLRAGRFFAPYGLRLAEHTTYVRRDLGFGLLEESYAVSGGFVAPGWELHVTGFGPDFLRHTGNAESGGAAMFEKRLGDALALGVDTRVAFADGAGRYQGGLFGKGYLASLKTMLMTQLDLVQRSVKAAAGSQQFVGLAGVTVFPVRGLWLAGFVERSQTAISVKDSAINALNGQINWFPYPHFELVLLGRLQQAAAQETARTLLCQVHYFL